MDSGIEFGEVEETPPEQMLRPDRNRHYATADCYTVRPGQLPVFVDLDVLRDMEQHALSDTTVELGGVLLGGQYEDEDGNPFVVISDSLRAKHYQATKGSFKFTHETWTEIGRERDEFPDEIQMVGWYHTHPGWGVFLSGMDTFICDHFFNRPLDVALVIDPCNDDRGFFQWTGDARNPLRRTSGFIVTASRFREAELQQFVAQLEGNTVPAAARSYSSMGETVVPAPQVHLHQPNPPWVGSAVMAALAIQTVLIALIGWQMLSPLGGQETALTKVEKQLEEMNKNQTAATRLEIERKVLDDVISQMPGGPSELTKTLQEERLAREEAETKMAAALDGYRILRKDKLTLDSNVKTLKADLVKEREKSKRLHNRLEQKDQDIAKLNEELKGFKGETSEESEESEEVATWRQWLVSWRGMLAMGAALFAVVVGTSIFFLGSRQSERDLDEQAEDFEGRLAIANPPGDEPPGSPNPSQEHSPESPKPSGDT